MKCKKQNVFFCFFVCVFSVPESDPCGGGKISNLFGKIIFCFTLYLESNVNCLHNFSSEKFWSLFFVNLLPHMSIVLQAMEMRFWKKNDCKLQVRSKLSVVVPPKKINIYNYEKDWEIPIVEKHLFCR